MTDRERLVELIFSMKSCLSNGVEDCKQCKYSTELDCWTASLADHLIANGVAVRKQGEASEIKVLFIGIKQPDESEEIYEFEIDFEIGGIEYHYRHKLTSELFECFGYEKVKYGRWIGNDLGTCTCCGHEGCSADIWYGVETPYCPNCGAMMDGGLNA